MSPYRVGWMVIGCLIGLAACRPAVVLEPSGGEQMSGDRDEGIRRVVGDVGRAADEQRWELAIAAFAPRVVLDYGVPELLAPDEIVARWAPMFAQFDETRHTISDLEVQHPEPDRALVASTFVAVHRMDDQEWTLGGRYVYELVWTDGAWKITRMRMIPEASTGVTTLADTARERAGLPAPAEPGYRVEHVRFASGTDTLVGLLHLPADAPPDARLPGLVVTGSWTTVKEQMPQVYAQRLATAGYAALTFDFRGFGESEGVPRRAESPSRKTEDLRAAVDLLATASAIDPERIGLVSVCASSGYAAAEASGDPRVRSLVMIAPWLHDAELVEIPYGERTAYGGTGVPALVAAGEAARERYARDGTVELVPAASASEPEAAMFAPDPEELDYYLNPARGGIPQWGNRFAVLSWPEWLGYDALASAPMLRTPTLVVHSENGAIPDGARRYAAAMPVPPKVVWIEGTQFDFYDRPATVDRAVTEALGHLAATLAPADRQVVEPSVPAGEGSQL